MRDDWLRKYLLLLVCWASMSTITKVSPVSGLSSSSSSSSPLPSSSFGTKASNAAIPLQSATLSQLAVVDGGEWNSIQEYLKRQADRQTKQPLTKKFGYCTVIAGKNDQNERLVGMAVTESSSNNNKHDVYKETAAKIPDKVSDNDAIQTYIASMVGIHCCLPKLHGIGGINVEPDEQTTFISGKTVIMGSNEYACFAADALSALGVTVVVVTTDKNPKLGKHSKQNKVQVVGPSMGTEDESFSIVLGKFDSLLDTFFDEHSTSYGGSRVMRLLAERNKCYKYVSTMSQAQKIFNSEGVIFGQGKANDHIKKLSTMAASKNKKDMEPIPPLYQLGMTVEALLEKGVIYKGNKKNQPVRGWSLGDFWLQASWPRDTSGSGTTRYGLPVIQDPEDDEDGLMISAPPRISKGGIDNDVDVDNDDYDYDDDNYDNDNDNNDRPRRKQARDEKVANPYVMDIDGVRGFNQKVAASELTGVLFLSAKWCKTCRSLNPPYTRIARQYVTEERPITFCKGETSGVMGKQLGKLLDVDAVPAFCLFKNGKQYGPPFNIRRFPSRKFELALQQLESGEEWDDAILLEADDDYYDDEHAP